MPANRFFIDKQLHEGEEVTLDREEMRHLKKVMRLKKGEYVELINGRGQLAQATVGEALQVESVSTSPPPREKIILVQAIPRFSRLDTILEKGTELGMDAIWLFPGERSEKTSFTPNQKERMRSILIAAMKQCGRLYLPEIAFKPPLLEWKKEDFSGNFYFGDLRPEAPLLKDSLTNSPVSYFLIGPEAGLSESEILILQKIGAHGVKLHPHILRTDTAPLVALTLISHWQMGENRV